MPSLGAHRTTFLIVLWQGGHQLCPRPDFPGGADAFNGYLTLLVWPMIALGWVTNIFFSAALLPWVGSITSSPLSRILMIATRKFQKAPSRAAKSNSAISPLPTRRLFRSGSEWRLQIQRQLSASRASRHSSKSSRRLHARHRRPTGSGKTTLAALIARLWEAPMIASLIDGRPIANGLSRRCANPSVSCHRTLTCLAKPSAATSPSGCRNMTSSASTKHPKSPASTVTSRFR